MVCLSYKVYFPKNCRATIFKYSNFEIDVAFGYFISYFYEKFQSLMFPNLPVSTSSCLKIAREAISMAFVYINGYPAVGKFTVAKELKYSRP